MSAVAVITGSVRSGSYSRLAALQCVEILADLGVQGILVDPQNYTLVFPGQEGFEAFSQKLQSDIKHCDGVVFVTPEYNGGLSSVIKLMTEALGYPSILEGKPCTLIGVGAGRVGAIKSLEQLRSICAGLGTIALPQSISVSASHLVYGSGKCENPEIEALIRGGLEALCSAIKKP